MSDDPKKKPQPEAADIFKNLSALMPQDEEAQKKWPKVWKLMMPIFRDGTCTRQPGGLRIKVEGTYFRIYLEAPTEGIQTSLLVEHLDGIFDQIEDFMGTKMCNWTPNYDRQKRSRPTIENLLM